MINTLKKEFQSILKIKLNSSRFLLSLVLLLGLVFGIVILSLALGGQSTMATSNSFIIASNVTLFSMLTIDLVLLLYVFCNRLRNKVAINYCKSYLLLGLAIVILSFIVALWFLSIEYV
ncbi:hypothetical protein [Flavivirga rizhaonensis]|uniref:Uncharacterized protein n=1 Tax=Flavivirga rizhaonensis TaxID=2559571 RepID=A0A4S1DU80_9FLAO|nr:hypothetical protein [Flavivirga rizhaonensis]TGV01365.1 hypothetical protein EM932_15660 [Flavivirga rizhaonensis]